MLYVRQVLSLLEMARARGIGMPRAKKKKVAVDEVIEEAPAEEPSPPEPAPPPSPPPQPARKRLPPSPSKIKLTNTRHKLRRMISTWVKQGCDGMADASGDLDKASSKYERQLDAIHRDEQRKLPLEPPRPYEIMERTYQAELQFAQAQKQFWQINYHYQKLFREAAKAEQDVLRAKIEWLTRQRLRMRARCKTRV